jgi:hypothetical protein
MQGLRFSNDKEIIEPVPPSLLSNVVVGGPSDSSIHSVKEQLAFDSPQPWKEIPAGMDDAVVLAAPKPWTEIPEFLGDLVYLDPHFNPFPRRLPQHFEFICGGVTAFVEPFPHGYPEFR